LTRKTVSELVEGRSYIVILGPSKDAREEERLSSLVGPLGAFLCAEIMNQFEDDDGAGGKRVRIAVD